MNTEIKTYHADDPLKSLIGTKRMYRWLEQMLERRADCLSDLRAYNGMTKAIASLMRSIRDTELFNYRIRTKWEMLRDPDWRARVFKELGGETALARWEARKAKVAQTKWAPRERPVSEPQQAPDKSKRKPGRRFVTDSQDQFRLAPITTERPSWAAPQPRDRTGEYRGPRQITLPDLGNIKFPIIPLEPFELRRACGIDKGNANTSSPRLWAGPPGGEVPGAIAEGDGGTLSSENPSHRSQPTGPPIDLSTIAESPLPPASREKVGVRPFANNRHNREAKPARTKHLALGTASDYVIDTSAPPPGAVLKISWPGFGPRPKSKDSD